MRSKMSTSKDKCILSFVNQQKLESLKKLRETVDWENEKERLNFLNQFHKAIKNWTGVFPDLRDYFQPEQIECILLDSLDCARGFLMPKSYSRGKRICEFVAQCDFNNESKADKNDKPLLRRTTVIHRVATNGHLREDKLFVDIISNLFKVYNKFDVNYIDQSGLSHFHVAVMSGCHEVVKSFLELGQDPNYPPQNSLEPPLHLALTYKRKEVVKLLLNHGADPNLLNKEGLTPLQNIIKQDPNEIRDGLARMLFYCSSKRYHPVQVDTRDPNGSGNTLLHLAIRPWSGNLFKLLLRKGANPNLLNAEGLTPLHVTCKMMTAHALAEDLFKLSRKKYRPLQVSTLDKNGNTPLNSYAMLHESPSRRTVVELLLRNGSDPNSANEDGSTPLHHFCKVYNGLECIDTLFKICDELNKTIQVDARDKLGWTPLQWAVANLLPHAVNTLLNRGADLSSFVFPTLNCFGKNRNHMVILSQPIFELNLAARAVGVTEQLKKRGYELYRSEALMIMELFVKYELFEKSGDFEKSWSDCENFRKEIKETPNGPMFKVIEDLLLLQPEEAAKTITYEKYLDLSSCDVISLMPLRLKNACILHLCEKLSRKFFRSWALNCFWELIHYRLPMDCCEMIVDKSFTNQDLYNICLAAELKSLEDGKKKVQSNEVECVKKGLKRTKALKAQKALKRQKNSNRNLIKNVLKCINSKTCGVKKAPERLQDV
uniref:Uncharacterized protein n=1 Tax=Trichogramma kaykai TaxID=54128 RepID=A0ABD2W1Z4_9HYME